ncbi:MAG TPA: tRNA preQ1(34) S-adenosylmethionine ribosyltransferase-isomerase QueA [Pyrinomonadaceae bacterium]|nr:tRNA preQ1(34) S-adenosylmethionine ribosyltransferase-isomerase QueA [Pyrinomonadaceae bacterium]
MRISDFDYELPPELIAQHPLTKRDDARMLVINRKDETWFDSRFLKLPTYLQAHDLLVINNTRVFRARLQGKREPTGGRVEVLLVREVEPLRWQALIRTGQRLKRGARLEFGEKLLRAEVVDNPGQELRELRFECEGPLRELLEKIGQVPLPPYIKRPAGIGEDDSARYQTVFARETGAIAAPTAGLHFTPAVLDAVRSRSVEIAEITLHVGYGTFEPVRVENIEEHKVAPESIHISAQAARSINETRSRGGRVFATGTTTTRALESAVSADGMICSQQKDVSLTIIPGHQFRIVDALVTNFHLPCSSLLMLVCAFAGRDLILNAYRHAVRVGYRFYSYGDCMLII